MWDLLTYFLTAFTAILIPTYWYYYGAQNFLWLSDISLFLTVAALWMHSPLLMSMAAVGILVLELVWNVDFFLHLLLNLKSIDLADYMFDRTYPLLLRAISLFHVLVPIIWIVYLAQFGYDERALYYFTGFYWVILLSTYFFTNPINNINWVFIPEAYKWEKITPRMWLIILFFGFPLFIFLPSHYILTMVFQTIH